MQDAGLIFIMNSQVYDSAKEKIRKALVYEYLKKNPGVREKDVVLACRKGELIFTEISTILADVELRDQSNQIFKQANSMFSELAIHHDQRWRDCLESSQHSIQMVVCLHSSMFSYFDDDDKKEQEKFFNRKEGLCAQITVQIHQLSQDIKRMNIQKVSQDSVAKREILLQYLKRVVDQLEILHEMLSREVELGDIFSTQTEKYLDIQFKNIKKTYTFNINQITDIYKALKNDKRATIDASLQFNESILNSTKNTLLSAVDSMKKDLTIRRSQIQEIWMAISSLSDTVKQIESIQELDKEGKLDASISLSPNGNRMVRFMDRVKQIIKS